MSRNPDLTKLDALFSKGNPFCLTDAQYEAKTGVMLPKGKYYLLNNSALAKLCKKKGYELKLQEKTVYFERKK